MGSNYRAPPLKNRIKHTPRISHGPKHSRHPRLWVCSMREMVPGHEGTGNEIHPTKLDEEL